MWIFRFIGPWSGRCFSRYQRGRAFLISGSVGGRAASGWRAGGRFEKQKTENRGGPGPPLRLDTSTWLLGQSEQQQQAVQRRRGGGRSRGGDVPTRQVGADPGREREQRWQPPMTVDRNDEPTAMQRQRKRRGGPAAELRWAAAETSADGGARWTRRHRSQGGGLGLHHEWACIA